MKLVKVPNKLVSTTAKTFGGYEPQGLTNYTIFFRHKRLRTVIAIEEFEYKKVILVKEKPERKGQQVGRSEDMHINRTSEVSYVGSVLKYSSFRPFRSID